jgi:tetratricopeptide (TPR) repeat protein
MIKILKNRNRFGFYYRIFFYTALLIIFGENILLGQKAPDTLKIYESGYRMEKKQPLFSIPIYEVVLKARPDAKLEKITAIRLYFLYHSRKKYPEMLAHYSRYHKILNLSKEHTQNLRDVYSYYRITGEQFYAVYPSLLDPNPDAIGTLLEYLIKQNSVPLFEFVYTMMMNRGNFDELRTLMFYLPEELAKPILRIGLVAKANDEITKETVRNYLERSDLTKSEISDTYYLYAQYLRGTGELEESIRFFRESGKLDKTERAKKEEAKSLVALGKIPEACEIKNLSFSPLSESDLALKILCSKKQSEEIPVDSDLRLALRCLAAKDNETFYRSVASWLFDS